MSMFFKLRDFGSRINFSIIEEKIGIELPKLYKIFSNTYILGDGNLIIDKYLNPQTNWINPCTSIVFLPFSTKRELYFYGFLNVDEFLKDWDVYGKNSKEWLQYGLIRIGFIDTGGGLYLGTRNEMADHIYRVVWDWKDNYEFVSNDIFEFIKGLSIYEDLSNMENYNYEDLYKNWGEDFWRIKNNALFVPR